MITTTNGEPAALYIRAAKKASGKTISSCYMAIEQFCAKYGYIPIAEYVDNGYSGRNINRPALLEMMQDATQNPTWKTIIVMNVSHISRDLSNVHSIEQAFNNHDISIICIDDYELEKNNITPARQLVAAVQSSMSQGVSAS